MFIPTFAENTAQGTEEPLLSEGVGMDTPLGRKAQRMSEDTGLTTLQVLQRKYWCALNDVLKEASGPISGDRTPQPASFMDYGVMRTNLANIGAGMNTRENRVRAQLTLTGANATWFFGLLEQQRYEIDQELGPPLTWAEQPYGIESRIFSCLENADPRNKSDWPRQHEWLADRLNRMHEVFAPRVNDFHSE